jgi:hypothetical protein
MSCEIDKYGDMAWRNSEGKLHRTDGPAIVLKSGRSEWYWNNKLHRRDGPAAIYGSGTKVWYVNGFTHRSDGPAILFADKGYEWHLRGIRVNKTDVVNHGSERTIKILLLTRLLDPFCEINVVKYCL